MAATNDNGAMRSYRPDVTEVPDDFRRLLEGYAGVEPENVVAHVNELRQKAWNIVPYPCIGQFKFLSLTLLQHPAYATLLERLRSGQTFLDMGSCFAQDVRQLVSDGVDSASIYGVEVEAALVSAGYDLFRDRDTLKTQFLIGDALDPPAEFARLHGKMDIINDSAFTHLFPWDQQVQLCELMARCSRPGALVVGRMTGSLKPAEYPSLQPGCTGFRHDVDSLQRLWDEAGRRTDTQWKAAGTMDLHGIYPVPGAVKDGEELPVWWEPNICMRLFIITRKHNAVGAVNPDADVPINSPPHPLIHPAINNLLQLLNRICNAPFIMVSPATWNTLGLGVAGTWAVLSAAATFSPHRTAELFGITALSDPRTTSAASALGFRGMVGSRDATIALILYVLAKRGNNRDLGAAILSTMTICVVDLYIVLRRRAYKEAAVLAVGSGIWAVIGLGLRGAFD